MSNVLFTGWWKRWWPRSLEWSSYQRCEHCLQAIRFATWTTFGRVSLLKSLFRYFPLTLLISVIQVLPQSFGNIYLGETFSSYVCVHNDSTEVLLLLYLNFNTWHFIFFKWRLDFTFFQGVWQCNSQSRSSNCITTDQLGAWNQSRHRSSFQVLQ